MRVKKTLSLIALLIFFGLTACHEPAQQADCNCPCPPKDTTYSNAYVNDLVKANHYLEKTTGDKFIATFNEFRVAASDTQKTDNANGQISTSLKLPENVSMPVTESFNNAAICEVLSIAGCVGVRMHYGINAEGRVVILISGINADGKPVFVQRKKQVAAATGADDLGNVKLMQPAGARDREEFYLEIGRMP